eukprot:352775-Chlamydomonas_euryale.AAC.14
MSMYASQVLLSALGDASLHTTAGNGQSPTQLPRAVCMGVVLVAKALRVAHLNSNLPLTSMTTCGSGSAACALFGRSCPRQQRACLWAHGCVAARSHVHMAAWLHGCMATWLHGRTAAWPHGHMAAWPDDHMAAWPHGCMAAWPHGCMAAWQKRAPYKCMRPYKSHSSPHLPRIAHLLCPRSPGTHAGAAACCMQTGVVAAAQPEAAAAGPAELVTAATAAAAAAATAADCSTGLGMPACPTTPCRWLCRRLAVHLHEAQAKMLSTGNAVRCVSACAQARSEGLGDCSPAVGLRALRRLPTVCCQRVAARSGAAASPARRACIPTAPRALSCDTPRRSWCVHEPLATPQGIHTAGSGNERRAVR